MLNQIIWRQVNTIAYNGLKYLITGKMVALFPPYEFEYNNSEPVHSIYTKCVQKKGDLQFLNSFFVCLVDTHVPYMLTLSAILHL